MAALASVLVILVCLWDSGWAISYQETRKSRGISSPRRIEEPCVGQSLCPSSDDENRANTICRSDADCANGEYCHVFHRLCLRPREPVTVAPVKTSAKKCAQDLDCKRTEYCHDFWRICLQLRKVYQRRPTKRPSWYCRTSRDCNVDQQCHRRFHACYTKPGLSAVRRDTGNSRRCDESSECGTNFYCHEHFRICLEDTPTATKSPTVKTAKTKACGLKAPCPQGLLCHEFWKICYTPASYTPVGTTTQSNKTRQCRTDVDCKRNEFCHSMVARAGHVVARQRRDTKSMCLPRNVRQTAKSGGDGTCKTDADCGPNKCCLRNVGVCMTYRLPGEMCLMAKAYFVCPCADGAYCKTRGKWASPRRIINKMKVPRTAANRLLTRGNRKKHKVGRCTPSSF